ncbi:MAG: DNA-binding protein [Mycobacterium sp.]|nr:DNA-binding protein [Mycobacterium sp.]
MSTETTTPRLLVPYDEARRLLGGIGRTKFYELIDAQELVRVSIGRRGFVTAESLTRFVESLAALPQRD